MRYQDRIRKSLQPVLNKKQDRRGNWPGQLGDGFGHLSVTGRSQYVYCRVAGQVQEVLCRRIPAENDLLVNVGYANDEPDLYQVLSMRGQNPGGTTGGAIAGYTLSIRYRLFYPGGGQDPLFVEGKQFLPGLVMPFSGMSVQVYQNVIWVGGNDFVSLTTQAVDLTSHIPATGGKAALVLLTVNDAGSIIDTKGSEVDLTDLGLDALPVIPTDTVNVLAAVRVYYGQTAVREGQNNTDIIDLRFSGWGISGSGDMLKSVYDIDENGVVDRAGSVDGIDSAGNSKYYGTDSGGIPGFYNLPGTSGAYDYILIRDEKTKNAVGGTFTAGAWRTRDLNTVKEDTGGHASLSSNQVTLDAGSYHCHIICPAYRVDDHQARLYDITHNQLLILGSGGFSVNGGWTSTSHSIIDGRFTLSESAIVEVQHYCVTPYATYGFGKPCNITTEVYTVAEFWKE